MQVPSTNDTPNPDDTGSASVSFMDGEDFTIASESFTQDSCLKTRTKGSMY